MQENSLLLLTGLSVAGAVIATILFGAAITYMLTDEERMYMDSPPAFLRPIWPLIRICTYFLGSNLPGSMLTKTDEKLQKNGVSFMLTAEEFISAQLILTLLLP